MDESTRILLINPNTADAVTTLLARVARAVAGGRAEIVARTALFGVPGIQTPAEAAVASDAVVEVLRAHANRDLANRDLANCDVAITAAFLDPGYEAATAAGLMPVVGFGRAGIAEAARGGRRFAIVTAGAAMRDAVQSRVAEIGLAPQLAAIRVIGPTVRDLIADPAAHRAEITAAARACLEEDGAEAVLLGGAPFAGLAAGIAQETGAPVLDGVREAVEAALAAVVRRRIAK